MAWQRFVSEAAACAAMAEYRARHFGVRRPGPPWPLAPEGHEAVAGGFSEKAARKAENAGALQLRPSISCVGCVALHRYEGLD